MGRSLKERLQQAGIVEMWQRRAEAVKEAQALHGMLEDVASEISAFDRLLFFHHTKEEREERRLKERLKDLTGVIATTSTEIDKFWEELAKQEPDIARARMLEELLRRCLAARKVSDVGFTQGSCQRWVEEHLKAGGSDTPLELDGDPAQLLRSAFSRPGQAHLIPLAALNCVLQMTEARREATWEGFHDTLLYRPVLIGLVGRVMAEFRREEPNNAFPIEIISDWILREHPELRQSTMSETLRELYPQGGSEEFFSDLIGLFEKLAGTRLALSLNKRGISLLDRAVFWSDTPAEAREKRLADSEAGLREEIATVWLDLERRLRGPRRDRWEFYVVDQALDVREAVRGIHTLSKESSWSFECPLLNQEPAIWQTQALSNEVRHHCGGLWTRQDLLKAAVQHAADPTVEDEPPQLGEISADQLPRVLGRNLRLGGFLKRRKALDEAHERLGEQERELKAVRSQISLWDRVNVFTETSAEASEKAAEGMARAQTREAGVLRESLDQEVELALKQIHQPALVGLVAVELGAAVESVRAESTSRRVRKGDSHETIYYCRLRGIEEAGAVLLRLLDAAAPAPGDYLAPVQALEQWVALDSPHAQAIHVLEMTVGN